MTRRVRIQRSRSISRAFHQQNLFIRGILGWIAGTYAAQRKINLENEKLLLAQQKRKIGEIEEGIRSNKLLLQDIQIEQKKLELIALKRKLGNPDEEFAPIMTER